jgi:hypothetical protein
LSFTFEKRVDGDPRHIVSVAAQTTLDQRPGHEYELDIQRSKKPPPIVGVSYGFLPTFHPAHTPPGTINPNNQPE